MSLLPLMRLGSKNLTKSCVAKFIQRNYQTSQILASEKSDIISEDEIERPYSYLNSEAAKWKAKETREPDNNRPECQNLVISLSVGSFLIYFCILREENDVDQIFSRDLKFYFPEMTDSQFNTVMTVGSPDVQTPEEKLTAFKQLKKLFGARVKEEE